LSRNDHGVIREQALFARARAESVARLPNFAPLRENAAAF
jgi:hypothetical protein